MRVWYDMDCVSVDFVCLTAEQWYWWREKVHIKVPISRKSFLSSWKRQKKRNVKGEERWKETYTDEMPQDEENVVTPLFWW